MRLGKGQAWAVLTVLGLAVAGCLAVSAGPPPKIGSADGGVADVALFYAVADRVHAGADYYAAMATELAARRYPTASVFNWRTPLPLHLIGRLPNYDWSRWLLGLAALSALALNAAGRGWRLIPLMALPLAITAMPHTILFAEVWSGVAIAISVGCYGLGCYGAGWRYAGAAIGVLALFFRELALPYALIGAILALRERRRGEAAVWWAGIAAYAIFLAMHARAVHAHIPAAAAPSDWSRWIQFGGVHFLLIASRTGLLLGLPFWLAALYLPLAVLGLWWRADLRVTATVAAYLAIFSLVGAPGMNFYWGALYTPLLALGIGWSWPAIRDLWHTAVTRPSPAGSLRQYAR